VLQGIIPQQQGLPMNQYLNNYNKFPSSVPKHVLVPEIERLSEALKALPALLQNSKMSLETISSFCNLSLTELRYDGWENLYEYIRSLETQLVNAQNKLATQDEKMRDLVIFVEKTSQNIVKLYREFSIRNLDE